MFWCEADITSPPTRGRWPLINRIHMILSDFQGWRSRVTHAWKLSRRLIAHLHSSTRTVKKSTRYFNISTLRPVLCNGRAVHLARTLCIVLHPWAYGSLSFSAAFIKNSWLKEAEWLCMSESNRATNPYTAFRHSTSHLVLLLVSYIKAMKRNSSKNCNFISYDSCLVFIHGIVKRHWINTDRKKKSKRRVYEVGWSVWEISINQVKEFAHLDEDNLFHLCFCPIITSAKDLMFSSLSVCLFVSRITRTSQDILLWISKEPIKFWCRPRDSFFIIVR